MSILSFTIENLAKIEKRSEREVFQELLENWMKDGQKNEHVLLNITPVEEIKRLTQKYLFPKFLRIKINRQNNLENYWGSVCNRISYDFDVLESENLTEQEIDKILDEFVFGGSDTEKEFSDKEIREILK